MKILLLGKNGQVGWELQRSLAPLGPLVALDRYGADGLCGDLADFAGITETVRVLQPQVIVNAAAHTAVDQAERDGQAAQRINAQAPAVLAQAAQHCGALLVHYGTDYVFDGSGDRPWAEDDPTGPLNRHGQAKLAGEQAIRVAGCRHLILRTGWVHAARGENFIVAMLRLARARERLMVVDDQWGAPTAADLVADVTAHAIVRLRAAPHHGGTYHVVASGETTWFDYARTLFDEARRLRPGLGLAMRTLVPISSADHPAPARRPRNSRLDTRRLQATFGLYLPPWQLGVRRTLAELLSRDEWP